MLTMYCNFTKSHTFPLIFRVSRRTRCVKLSQSFNTGPFSNGSHVRALENNHLSKRRNFSNGSHLKTLENIHGVGVRKFSNGSYRESMENGSGERERKVLPWIAGYKSRESKGSDKMPTAKTARSTWEESASSYFSKNSGKGLRDDRENRVRTKDESESLRSGYNYARSDEGEAEEEDIEPVNDPRWDRIKTRYNRITERESERPEVRRWNNQENWGKKTWKEATVSTLPKMVGEGIYGVGPVLAALTVGRREFYTLYVQEGLDLSGNNRKKKDKKGVEKVLQIAERIGLTVKETSKHDLNMVADNRPHQGLVLDASPLEMVSIRELDFVSPEGDKAPLWVALDEVTDPQNLGAIIRSSYFFGAAGVVICAKNSAPLSGVVSKASAGALELVELRSCKNMMQFLTSSSENGWRVLGGSVSPRAVPLNDVKLGEPTILVLGSEGRGLRPLVEKSCSQLIRIPGNIPVQNEEIHGEDQMYPGKEYLSFLAVESLNVSVATGVLLYHLVGNSVSHVGNKEITSIG